jgi:MOSC domain-containing protein YiiM
MKVLSTNNGKPEPFTSKNGIEKTSMNRKPQSAGITLDFEGVQGDSFDEPQFHGTPDNKLYALGLETHRLFSKEIGAAQIFTAGAFGENLTMDEIDESKIFMGDIFDIGSTQVQATYPRIPCSKLNLRFQNPKALPIFFKLRRPGVYFRVLKAGKIITGDELKLLSHQKNSISIRELYDWITSQAKPDLARVEELKKLPSVPDYVLKKFAKFAGATV